MIELFQAGTWQMTVGERATLEGILHQLKPRLAIEIGTAEGGSLSCIAAHATEVHSLDLVAPSLDLERFPSVTVHTGDSHESLPVLLRELAHQNRNVDFALVDGDHTAEGVQQDVEDLLDSPTLSRTVILVHDAANEIVRAGLEAVDYGSWPKVSSVDHDFVPGYLVKTDRFHHQIWGGLGLILIEDGRSHAQLHTVSEVAYPIAPILADHRARVLSDADDEETGAKGQQQRAAEIDELRSRLADIEERLIAVVGSRTWRMTTPLRRLAARLRG